MCQCHDEIHKTSTISVKGDLIKLELWLHISIQSLRRSTFEDLTSNFPKEIESHTSQGKKTEGQDGEP